MSLESWILVAVLGAVALLCVAWLLADELRERRRARAAATMASRYAERAIKPVTDHPTVLAPPVVAAEETIPIVSLVRPYMDRRFPAKGGRVT